jgi:acetyltransferase-like isoleucine patch superfamily enzyme
MSKLLLRALRFFLALPSAIRDRLHCARLRQLCTAAKSAELSPLGRIFNAGAKGAIEIGANSLCMGEMQVIGTTGRIRVGEWCYVGPESKLWAKESIEIGDRVFISHRVQIFDNNSHSLSAAERHERYRELREIGRHRVPETVASRPVQIGDDVWIGFNAAVLKGVSIGRGAVIGACAVVTHDVPPYSVVVGNPARQVGESHP